MNIENADFLKELNDAEMVLIGIGEEFNNVKKLRKNKDYDQRRKKVDGTSSEWLIPVLNRMYSEQNSDISEVLHKFADLISDKNYFIVSVSTNELIRQVTWREKRLVMPCGGSCHKQCINKCENTLTDVTDEDIQALETYIKSFDFENGDIAKADVNIGSCPKCGSPMVLNNIYLEKYDENGYLEQWQYYTKWLQGTLNRKLLVLELGVGMQCPNVIRWPFEKVAFFNQKASFWRVNETLYQLSEEIKEKGTSISKNAIDWLRDLC